MILFWIAAAVLVAGALVFIVPPLLRPAARGGQTRDELNLQIHEQNLRALQAEYGAEQGGDAEALERELKRNLLDDLREREGASLAPGAAAAPSAILALVLALGLVVGTGALYLSLGAPVWVTGGPPVEDGAASPEEIAAVEEMVQRLADRLEAEPDNAEGWAMLGRSYLVLERYEESVRAYRRARDLQPDNVALGLDLAEALVLASRGQPGPVVDQLVQAALTAEPDNAKALWMAGHLAFAGGDVDAARAHWQRLLRQLPEGSPEAGVLRQRLAGLPGAAGATPPAGTAPGTNASAAARAPGAAGRPGAAAAAVPAPVAGDGRAAMPAGTGPDAGVPGADAAAVPALGAAPRQLAPGIAASAAEDGAGAGIDVRVRLDPAVAAAANPDDTVFVFARAVSGPRMPLAIVRTNVAALPLTVRLDDTTAMAPGMRLSVFDEVEVIARVSRTGSAMPASGDLQGQAGPLSPGDTAQVDVIINAPVP